MKTRSLLSIVVISLLASFASAGIGPLKPAMLLDLFPLNFQTLMIAAGVACQNGCPSSGNSLHIQGAIDKMSTDYSITLDEGGAKWFILGRFAGRWVAGESQFGDHSPDIGTFGEWKSLHADRIQPPSEVSMKLTLHDGGQNNRAVGKMDGMAVSADNHLLGEMFEQKGEIGGIAFSLKSEKASDGSVAIRGNFGSQPISLTIRSAGPGTARIEGVIGGLSVQERISIRP